MDLEPTTVSGKRPRTKAVRADSAPKLKPKPKPKRKTLTASRTKVSAVSTVVESAEPQAPFDMNAAIATTAFYLAAQRGFAPGGELDDWLEAERRVRALQSA
jgi:Protein of unknown function (DUF2934)